MILRTTETTRHDPRRRPKIYQPDRAALLDLLDDLVTPSALEQCNVQPLTGGFQPRKRDLTRRVP